MVYGSSKERECAICGKKIYLRCRPTEYTYRIKDYQKDSPTANRVLYFCSQACMKQFREEHPKKTYNRM